MSRFIDKLKKQSVSAPSPIGFRRALPTEAIPTILLVAGVTIDDAGSPINKIIGADAVLIFDEHDKLSTKMLPKMVKPLSDTPWGIFMEDCGNKSEAQADTGYDFIVTSPDCPISAVPQNEKTGKILQVESSMDNGLLRATNDLPVDAVLAADTFGESGTLVWHHLMILSNLAAMIRKPLIVPVPRTITGLELKALWDAGIEAVVVPVDTASGEDLKELHEIAVKLLPRARKHGKADVILPHPSERPAQPPPEEGEEDD